MSDKEKNSQDKSAREKIKDIVDEIADAAEEIEETVEEVKEAAKEVVEEVKDNFKEKYVKVLAEMENLRKRFESERQDVMKYKASSFIQNILPTVDMFEMALNAQNLSDEVKNWLVGFEMIFNNFKTALESEGVKEIKVNKGDEFDANFHFAIEEVETDEVESGKIYQVKSKGYTLHDKLIRPATVVVAKKEVQQEETKEEN